MSYQLNFLDILNAISLPELADGPMPCGSPGGLTTGPSGPDRAHANLSARQAREGGLTTTGTFGRLSSGSFASASLQLSMENRLRERLDVNGSPWCDLTWKRQDMPSGLPILRLARSGRGTKGHGISGLPTPSGCSNGGKNHVVGRLDEWGGSSNPFRGTEDGKKRCASFEAWMMGYPTAWLSRMVSEMRLSHKSRKRS
jgi:hypothetical protein